MLGRDADTGRREEIYGPRWTGTEIEAYKQRETDRVTGVPVTEAQAQGERERQRRESSHTDGNLDRVALRDP